MISNEKKFLAAVFIILLMIGYAKVLHADETVAQCGFSRVCAEAILTAGVPKYQMSDEDIALEEAEDQKEMLAICVEAEAGGESYLAKQIVAAVILNRVASDDYPDTIAEVIAQEGQFSSYTDGGMERHNIPSEETYQAVRSQLEHIDYPSVIFFSDGMCYNGRLWQQINNMYFATK